MQDFLRRPQYGKEAQMWCCCTRFYSSTMYLLSSATLLLIGPRDAKRQVLLHKRRITREEKKSWWWVVRLPLWPSGKAPVSYNLQNSELGIVGSIPTGGRHFFLQYFAAHEEHESTAARSCSGHT